MTTEGQPSTDDPNVEPAPPPPPLQAVETKAQTANEPDPTPDPKPISSSYVWRFLLLTGLVAGLLGFALIEVSRSLVSRDDDLVNSLEGREVAQAEESHRQDVWIELMRSTMANSIFGGMMGLMLGLAGGLIRTPSRWPRTILVAMLGLLIGAAVGVGLSLVVVPWHQKAIDASAHLQFGDMISPLLATMAIWVILGILGGLAFGQSLGGTHRQTFRAVEGGIIGAVIGAFVYEFAGALLMTTSKTELPIATEWPGRLLAALCFSIFLAFGIAMAAPQRPVRNDPRKVSPSGSMTSA